MKKLTVVGLALTLLLSACAVWAQGKGGKAAAKQNSQRTVGRVTDITETRLTVQPMARRAPKGGQEQAQPQTFTLSDTTAYGALETGAAAELAVGQRVTLVTYGADKATALAIGWVVPNAGKAKKNGGLQKSLATALQNAARQAANAQRREKGAPAPKIKTITGKVTAIKDGVVTIKTPKAEVSATTTTATRYEKVVTKTRVAIAKDLHVAVQATDGTAASVLIVPAPAQRQGANAKQGKAGQRAGKNKRANK